MQSIICSDQGRRLQEFPSNVSWFWFKAETAVKQAVSESKYIQKGSREPVTGRAN